MRDLLPATLPLDHAPDHVAAVLDVLQPFADRMAQRYGAAVYLTGGGLITDDPPEAWPVCCVLPDDDFCRVYGPAQPGRMPTLGTDTHRRWMLDTLGQGHGGSRPDRGVFIAFEVLPLGTAREMADHPRIRLDTAPRMSSDTGVVGEPVHHWFSLSYASYAVQPRVMTQSMPAEWQERYVQCLRELDAAFTHLPQPEYQITTGTWHAPEDLGETTLTELGWAVNEHAPTEVFDPEGTAHHAFQKVVFLPGPDPLPGYDRGRTRLPLFTDPEVPA